MPAAEPGRAFLPVNGQDFYQIFSIQRERVVAQDNTVRLRERTPWGDAGGLRRSHRGAPGWSSDDPVRAARAGPPHGGSGLLEGLGAAAALEKPTPLAAALLSPSQATAGGSQLKRHRARAVKSGDHHLLVTPHTIIREMMPRKRWAGVKKVSMGA